MEDYEDKCEQDCGDNTHEEYHDNWGTFGWAPFLYEFPVIQGEKLDALYDNTMMVASHYTLMLKFEKNKSEEMGTWEKTTTWNYQVEDFDTMKYIWDSEMHKYLATLRTSADNYGGRGRAIKRNKMI